MTKLYVSEYTDAQFAGNSHSVSIVIEPTLNDQVVDYTAGAATSTAFKNNTRFVRIATDAICSVLFGTAPTAATTNSRMAAGETRIVGVPMGAAFKVSAITNT